MLSYNELYFARYIYIMVLHIIIYISKYVLNLSP